MSLNIHPAVLLLLALALVVLALAKLGPGSELEAGAPWWRILFRRKPKDDKRHDE